MDFSVSPQIFTYVILPILIFCSRIMDVSIGTFRIIMISRGNKTIAAFLGFFEVIIWLIAVTQVLKNLDNIVCYIAYGGGFAAGNYIGVTLENRLALGVQSIQIITEDNMKALSMLLREEGYAVTNLTAQGYKNQMDFLYLVIPRKQVKYVIDLVHQFDEKAFISVSDIRNSYAGYINPKNRRIGIHDLIKKK
jgi:uncharacterized protein YebE (UPF0316 family)